MNPYCSAADSSTEYTDRSPLGAIVEPLVCSNRDSSSRLRVNTLHSVGQACYR